ncbi:hypothetical protein [Streptomyces mexicanus]|uniref:Uncharacterized protein n=1 Tax=Streptomyces mexicanus TaxID=178566 RepID=A0A7X1I2K4_9ACTN|nr:hypothetical protein [Streptomyces mexicanus]MBC2867321.1 hypothetical protein [Streptomyces mexicanus]
MSEPTQHETAPDSPRTIAWCSWHQGLSGTARLVRIIEQASGPGAGLYACAPCREAYRLVPVADQR